MRRFRWAIPIICCVLVLTVMSCSKDPAGSSSGGYQGITETDRAGRVLSVDPDDWNYDADYWEAYLSRYEIGENLRCSKSSLVFYSSFGGTDSRSLSIWNFSDVPVDIVTTGSSPDIQVPTGTHTIDPDEIHFMSVDYTHNSEDSTFAGTLDIHSDPPDEILSVEILGIVPAGPVDAEDAEFPDILGFGPAFPNPTNHSTTLVFTLIETQSVSVLIDAYGEGTIKILMDDQPRDAGLHMVVWDGTDDGGEPVPEGIYRARLLHDDGEIQGDIQILR